jgi:hypothetical protein
MKLRKGTEHLLVVQYCYPGEHGSARGNVISEHKTYEAAARAAKRHPYPTHVRIATAGEYHDKVHANA